MSRTVSVILCFFGMCLGLCLGLFFGFQYGIGANAGQVRQVSEELTAALGYTEELEERLDLLLEKVAYLEEVRPSADIAVDRVTRGMRNCNPMNIAALPASDPWLGQTGVDDKGHAIFANYQYGLRAGYLTLRAYQQKHGLTTLNAMMRRYCQGDSVGYATMIAKRIGVDPNDHIDVLEHMPGIMKAIVAMENGCEPFPDEWFIPYKRR